DRRAHQRPRPDDRRQARPAAADPAPQRPPGAGDGGARRLGLPPERWAARVRGRRRRAVSAFADGLSQAWHLVTTGDEQVVDITLRTVRIAFEATAFAAAIGL